MTTDALGKLSFLDTPDVNGVDVLLNAGGVPSISSGTTGARPAAAIVGRIYIDTTTNRIYRDNGTSWDDLTQVPLIDGTPDQIDVADGTNVTPSVVSLASNPIIPGTGRARLPTGTTAQRQASPAAGDARMNSNLATVEFYNGAFWKPTGKLIQFVSGTIAATTTTTQVPFDNTLPTNAEGTQIWSQAFTPLSSTSTITIHFTLTAAHGTATRTIIASAFAGSTNIGACSQYLAAANTSANMGLRVVHQPGSTAPITYSARVGASGSGTCYINQTSAVTLGGALASDFTIIEIE